MDPTTTDDTPLNAKQAATEVGLSLAAFWRGVAARRLPAPVYPAARAPRWFRSELRAALAATRALPSEQKVARRAKPASLPRPAG
jgi:predicted DNA-binding transcriptional regulator AlpA